MTQPIHPAVHRIAARAVDPKNPPVCDTPTVADQDRLLGAIVERDGATGLLLAGRRIDGGADDPLVLALLNSPDPAVLLDKIERLNRFFHADHRHRTVHVGERELELEHVATSGSTPSPVQSLFVCGLYVALLEAIGCERVTVRLPASPRGDSIVYDAGATIDVPLEGTWRWHFEWERQTHHRVLDGLDEVLLRHLPPDLERGSATASAARVMAADLSRSWRVRDVAAALNVSSRTLQRQVKAENTSFSDLLTTLRLTEAQRLLRDTSMSIGDIGYTTGFADTAHFSRTFRDRLGEPPSAWRSHT